MKHSKDTIRLYHNQFEDKKWHICQVIQEDDCFPALISWSFYMSGRSTTIFSGLTGLRPMRPRTSKSKTHVGASLIWNITSLEKKKNKNEHEILKKNVKDMVEPPCNTIICLQHTHKRHSISRREGEVWGIFCWFTVSPGRPFNIA